MDYTAKSVILGAVGQEVSDVFLTSSRLFKSPKAFQRYVQYYTCH